MTVVKVTVGKYGESDPKTEKVGDSGQGSEKVTQKNRRACPGVPVKVQGNGGSSCTADVLYIGPH